MNTTLRWLLRLAGAVMSIYPVYSFVWHLSQCVVLLSLPLLVLFLGGLVALRLSFLDSTTEN